MGDYGNRSGRGAEVQGMMMTIFRTLEKRGVNSVDFLVDYVKQSMHNHDTEEKSFDEVLPCAS